MSELAVLHNLANEASKAIGVMGLGRTEVLLSEGRCPTCLTRSSQADVLEGGDESDDRRHPTAVVNCADCRARWRCGSDGGDGEGPWIEHAHAAEGLILTLTINPPFEEDDEDWWDEDE